MTSWPRPHLIPPAVVNHHHAAQVQHHAQALEGGHGQPQSSVLLDQAGRVVLAVGAAFAAGKALSRHFQGLISAQALILT